MFPSGLFRSSTWSTSPCRPTNVARPAWLQAVAGVPDSDEGFHRRRLILQWPLALSCQVPNASDGKHKATNIEKHCTNTLLRKSCAATHHHAIGTYFHPEFVYPTGSQKTTWTPHLNAMVSTTSFRSSGSALLVPSTRNPLKSAKDKTARGVMNLSSPRFVSFGGRNNCQYCHFFDGQIDDS